VCDYRPSPAYFQKVVASGSGAALYLCSSECCSVVPEGNWIAYSMTKKLPCSVSRVDLGHKTTRGFQPSPVNFHNARFLPYLKEGQAIFEIAGDKKIRKRKMLHLLFSKMIRTNVLI